MTSTLTKVCISGFISLKLQLKRDCNQSHLFKLKVRHVRKLKIKIRQENKFNLAVSGVYFQLMDICNLWVDALLITVLIITGTIASLVVIHSFDYIVHLKVKQKTITKNIFIGCFIYNFMKNQAFVGTTFLIIHKHDPEILEIHFSRLASFLWGLFIFQCTSRPDKRCLARYMNKN